MMTSTADDESFNGPFADYTSSAPAAVPTDQLQYYEAVRYYVNHVVIPAVLAFGAVGNVVVLRRLSVARQQRLSGGVLPSSGASLRAGTTQSRDAGPWRRQPSERSSLVGLMALSISDLLFIYLLTYLLTYLFTNVTPKPVAETLFSSGVNPFSLSLSLRARSLSFSRP